MIAWTKCPMLMAWSPMEKTGVVGGTGWSQTCLPDDCFKVLVSGSRGEAITYQQVRHKHWMMDCLGKEPSPQEGGLGKQRLIFLDKHINLTFCITMRDCPFPLEIALRLGSVLQIK
jgi:hypothetical protein